jgi:hypothetical protein
MTKSGIPVQAGRPLKNISRYHVEFILAEDIQKMVPEVPPVGIVASRLVYTAENAWGAARRFAGKARENAEKEASRSIASGLLPALFASQ